MAGNPNFVQDENDNQLSDFHNILEGKTTSFSS